ncbi:MAG: dipeptidyl-peptidase 3 family protein [Candidatus Woesearchaeota archaeon]
MKIKIMEFVEGCAVLQLPVWGFEKLSLKDKLLTFYLWHASISGDRIFYDQNYRHGLSIRDFFLDLIIYKRDIKKDLYDELLVYTKSLVINHGNHDARSTVKFLPRFTLKELADVVTIVSKKGFKHELTDELRKVIFDSNYDVMLTQKNPKSGDIITESKNNLYQNVLFSDLKGFKDKYPLNSTVVKINGTLSEKVWRCGDSKTSPGMYSSEIRNIVKNLRLAQECSDDSYKKILGLLITYFETGNPEIFDEYNIAWLSNDPKVDTILGFIEQYLDARGFKGMYEGVVFFRDEESNKIIKSIANLSQYLEDNAPWSDKYKKKWTKIPVANAVVQIMATGGGGPVCFAGVNLPNAQNIREKYNSKNFYVSNVTYAGRMAFVDLLWKEFIEKPDDIKLLKDSFIARGPALVTLHEIVGHGSGKVNPKLKGDPRDYLLENYSTLEELRAELCALYHIFNERLIKEKIVTEKDAKGAYLSYVISYLTQLRRYASEDMIHEDHERATSVIVRYLLEKGSCKFYTKNVKTYAKIVDCKLMRKHVGELLSEVMRIKAEGDYAAGKNLVERYGVYFDLKLRDQIVSRAKKINYPNNHAYVMYHPELVYSKLKEIVDVKLVPYTSILEQAQHWRELYG